MKYMGGKSKLKKYIVPILQKIIDSAYNDGFIDLFCGGCSIVEDIVVDSDKIKIANDISKPLIELFKQLQIDNNCLPDNVSKNLYDDVRSNRNDYMLWFQGAVGFLASYNGRYFDGGYAKPTVYKNTIRDYYQESKRNIEKQIKKLKDVQFISNDYRNIELKNCIIYADIPYKNTKQYNTSKNFDYESFYSWCRTNSKNNIIVVSEISMPDDFVSIWKKEHIRTINAKNKTKSEENLFVHKTVYEKIKYLLG